MRKSDSWLRTLSAQTERRLGARLPNARLPNYICSVNHYIDWHRRKPRRISHPDAEFCDFSFWRAISNEWTPFEISCVDKEFAKKHAIDLSGGALRVAETRAVLNVAEIGSLFDLRQRLHPFLQRDFVAKPTHTSGSVVFLDNEPDDHEVSSLLTASRSNFFFHLRESQYFSLDRKIIIEDMIDSRHEIVDYKFFCSRGRVLLCQVDIERHTARKKNLYSVPEFSLLELSLGAYDRVPEFKLPKRRSLDQMIDIASTLSKPFRFVRVDLYNVRGEIFFGEFTFTPDAGLLYFSDATVSRQLLNRVR